MSEKKDIKKVAVMGAGTMGSAIAQHFAMKGLPVVLVDVSPQSLEKGMGHITKSLEEAVQRKVMRPEDLSKMMATIVATNDFKKLSDCDLVIEAVFEDFDVKEKLFKTIEKEVVDSCILASNTSSYSIADLGRGLKKQDRFVGVHYFYHAAKNKLVEIIPGTETSPEVISRLENFYNLIDKIPINVKDAAGFAVNRFFVPWLNEAARLYEEGFGSPALIDEVAKREFKIGMGPFALMNATGVPIAYHAANNLAEKFGAFYLAAASLKKQTEIEKKPWDLTAPSHGKTDDEDAIKRRLLATALGVAAQMVSEGVADVTDTDLAARVGLRWEQGPFELTLSKGLNEIRSYVSELFQKWDMPMPTLLETGDESKLRPLDVRWSTRGENGFIAFNRPDSMNALSEQVMSQLTSAFSALDGKSDIKKIYFVSRGKAFVAGADIKFFLKNIEAKNIDHIYQFTAAGQALLEKISSSAKTTVAYVDGLTLGGGLELALACQYRVATSRTLMAFPETGIGIYPGLGGTQRTPRLVGKGLAKFLVATGQMINATMAQKYGLVDVVIERTTDYDDLARVKLERHPISENFPEEVFADFTGDLPQGGFSNEVFVKYEKALLRKAPLALKKSMELIDEGMKAKDLRVGLALEMASLNEIFTTQDAYNGLKSIITREKPQYKGA